MITTSLRTFGTMPVLSAAVVVSLLFVVECTAQRKVQPIFSHPLTSEQSFPLKPNRSTAVDTLRILAVMVAFQEDNDSRTSGNGSFDLSSLNPGIIDPPPRNRNYFQDHLTFVGNYFRKASDGKCIVSGTVLDSVYRLPHLMQYYSPSRSSSNNIELGRLMEDAWKTVDSVTPGIQYDQYDAFIIFHAGVGRDIDLVSIFGYDPTPFDIPSLYVGLPSLRKMFGNSYNGIPVGGGLYNITSSMIIPETESREVSTIGGTALLELGINGLLVASVGSHLGLPDLFNTATGRSGIGRFGLMDGQSIFSWNGVFPPEPSAWEKYYLGWIDPLVAPAGELAVSVPAVSLSGTSDSVYRASVSAKEYFLIENRNRDANRDGSIITMVHNGVTTTKTFARDTTGFNAFDQDSLSGVITDMDEFDWSLPGGVNSRTREFFDGGMLIWHIDENIIEANYRTATVNANPERRGVDLEEADGSQDIGQSYGFLSPGSGSEDGTALDFWYQGNSAPLRVRSNTFTPVSNPNSLSNDYANSHISVKDFSVRAPRMTATIQIGDDNIKPLAGFPKNLNSSPGSSSVLPADLDGDGIPELVIGTSGKQSVSDTIFTGGATIAAYRQNGNPFYPTAAFVDELYQAFDQVIAVDINDDGNDDIATFRHVAANSYQAGTGTVYSPIDGNSDNMPDVLYQTSIISSDPIGEYIVTATPSNIIWGGDINWSLNKTTGAVDGIGADPFVGVSTLGFSNILVAIGDSVFIERVDTNNSVRRVNLGRRLIGSPAIGDLDHDGIPEIVVASKDGYVFVLDSSLTLRKQFSTGGDIGSSPAIADLDDDGNKDIVITSGKKLFVYNNTGSLLNYFPIDIPSKQEILSSPVVGDVDGDEVLDILLGTQEGIIHAYNAKGNRVDGFPLQTGGKVLTSPTLFKTAAGKVGIAVGTEDHFLYAWEYNASYDSSSMPWPMYLHDPQHSGFEGSNTIVNPISAEFLPKARAYNWPNPVGPEHAFKTNIRYYVGNDAVVNIKIFDFAGDLVKEFVNLSSAGGLDHEIVWDVSEIQSGVYFAHIEAEGSGNTESAVVKIAVVK
jgi:hypothetical protein